MSNSNKNAHLLKPILGFSLAIDLIILDQISKWWVLEHIFKPNLAEGASKDTAVLGLADWLGSSERLSFVSIDISSFFSLTMVWNQGISFGLFQNGNPWPLIILALIISLIFSIWLIKSKSWIETIALAMVIGGALGNVIDRLHFGAVADFLDFYIGDWHYPAFNLADSFISVGIVILLLNSLFFDRNKEEVK